MSSRPSIISVMTPFPHSVDVDATVRAARVFLREYGIHHLPVTRGKELVGVITDRDIKLCLGPDFDYPDEGEIRVSEVMIDAVYVVDVSCPLDDVLLTMSERHYGSTLVTKEGKLVGIFTCTDACRHFGQELQQRYAINVEDSIA